MRLSAHRRLRRLAVVPVLLAAVAAPATASAATCAGANTSPAKLGEAQMRRTTLCLLNQVRAAHGLQSLHADPRLDKAALGHSLSMVAHGYFAHESRSGAPFTARIAQSGWTRSRPSYVVGENIGWGSDDLGTAGAMVSGWMNSAPHRTNILEPRYSMIGIGVAVGVPFSGADGATYSTDFGG